MSKLNDLKVRKVSWCFMEHFSVEVIQQKEKMAFDLGLKASFPGWWKGSSPPGFGTFFSVPGQPSFATITGKKDTEKGIDLATPFPTQN